MESCWAVYGDAASGADSRAVNHVEQMHQSRCFSSSPDEKKLGCISCHDPHEKPAKASRIEHYRTRCLNCHQDKGCSIAKPERERKAPGDSCIECHMPRYDSNDIPHNAATNHRIPRRATGEAIAEPGDSVLTRFHSVAIGEEAETAEVRETRPLRKASEHRNEAGRFLLSFRCREWDCPPDSGKLVITAIPRRSARSSRGFRTSRTS